MNGVAIGGDRGPPDLSLFVAQDGRFHDPSPSAPSGLTIRALRVVDPEGDVVHAVSVHGHMPGHRMVRMQRGGEDKTDLALDEHIRDAVALTCFGTAVRNQRHAERRSVIVGRLFGIADVELNVVRSVDGQKIHLLAGAHRRFGSLHRAPVLICYCALSSVNWQRCKLVSAFPNSWMVEQDRDARENAVPTTNAMPMWRFMEFTFVWRLMPRDAQATLGATTVRNVSTRK